jgi:hypothetical protein
MNDSQRSAIAAGTPGTDPSSESAPGEERMPPNTCTVIHERGSEEMHLNRENVENDELLAAFERGEIDGADFPHAVASGAHEQSSACLAPSPAPSEAPAQSRTRLFLGSVLTIHGATLPPSPRSSVDRAAVLEIAARTTDAKSRHFWYSRARETEIPSA